MHLAIESNRCSYYYIDMEMALDHLADAKARLTEIWERHMPPFGADLDGGPSKHISQMDDVGLLETLDFAGDGIRLLESLAASAAGAIASRSGANATGLGLAAELGFGSASKLVADRMGVPVTRAKVLVRVGEAIVPSTSLTGEAVLAKRPHLATVIDAVVCPVSNGDLVREMLDRVAPRVKDPKVLDAAERMLAVMACEHPYERLAVLVRRVEAHLDPDGVEPVEADLYEGRSLSIRVDKNGYILVNARLDPESGSPLKALFESLTTATLRNARGHNRPDPDVPADMPAPVIEESRTIAQIQADILADLGRRGLSCDQTIPGATNASVVVRMDYKDIEKLNESGQSEVGHRATGGQGFATIDGVDQAISVSTVRKMLCHAEIIPAVFGGKPVPLDWGRGKRLFTRAQTLALWERDGGCASCGNTLWVETHHMKWWDRDQGRTDLNNGVLLCSRCHHVVHRQGWEIQLNRITCKVEFIPPPHIDPARTPIPGMHSHALRAAKHKDTLTRVLSS